MPFLRLATAALALVYVLHATAPHATITAVAAPEATPALPADARAAWAVQLAAALGNTQPSADLIAALVAWSRAEDGCEHGCGVASALERNNPLNSTEATGAIATINGDGVKAYPDAATGIAATVITLGYDYPGYAEIAAGIQTNDVPRLFAGIHASPWCQSCYGGNIERLYQEARQQ